MSNNVESPGSKRPATKPEGNGAGAVPSGWLKMGAVAATSALLGGLAAAWFYRKTLSQFREAEERIPDSEFIATDDWPEDF